ncbi:beta-N-acetylhexosaminidase [Undibacterium oligocarboniphilum]|uniref:Beta-N-acetylhexosaminidase n=2 Tax=Undibacterium oligocarboniphilum TaxID=666702 RepID=A0A850QKI4_9BURK|nr:beta-N-acetylhexosaminidase [Undibacterium oligocarboniphilum]NVO77240.1 beta-N-acetylhexosaminidase [Undibacterium oligocarboniphilum]
MIRMPITRLDAESAAYLKQHHIRAICLFRGNMSDELQLKKLTADLRAVMGPEALIAIDQEGGAVVRSTWVPQPPAAMSLGASNDPELCYQVGAAVARGVKALGFNWNFAPVLDLNNNVDNPVISERSFGSDPQRASALALAWMDGSLSEGVACCVKHFPGHGDTNVDSHRDLPTVDKTREQLQALELVPFQIAVSRNAPAIMTAHIVYPALDADNPATMSKAILTDLLREQWQYQGVVITDGMDMHAIAGRYGVGNAAVKALLAGADMVMALGTTETQLETLDALTAVIASGQISRTEVAQRLARVQQLTATYPCQSSAYQTELADRILMSSAWKRGLTTSGNPLPPARDSKVRLVISADVVSDGVSEAGIPAAKVSAMLASLYDLDTVTFDNANTFEWHSLPQDGRFVILASTVRIRYSQHIRDSWKPDLHLVLWNPFQMLDIQAPALMTYGFAPPAIDAARAWLAGEITADGQIPVSGFSV